MRDPVAVVLTKGVPQTCFLCDLDGLDHPQVQGQGETLPGTSSQTWSLQFSETSLVLLRMHNWTM